MHAPRLISVLIAVLVGTVVPTSPLPISPVDAAVHQDVVGSSEMAQSPADRMARAQPNCFPETGFCVSNPAFAEYFHLRGGIRILGYPISREFTLEGFQVQFFQRVVLQLQGNNVERLNVLDPSIMPMTRANQSVFPASDPRLAASAPPAGAPDYARRVVDFVQSVAPDTWNGQPVGFFMLFNSGLPGTGTDPELTTLLNLEIWGLPTSRPAFDPGNQGFVYQRFQRGIMHYRADCNCTEGVLVGEYFKAVITGSIFFNLPWDLAQDMQDSRYYGQYNPAGGARTPDWVDRPAELPNTSMAHVFSPDVPQRR